MPDETLKYLPESLKDELNDVIKYAKMAKKTHYDNYAQIYRDMAREEHQHARHIKDIVLDQGISLPNQNEVDELFEKADNALKEM